MSHSHTPLTDAQKQVLPYQTLPSGEANFYDESQNPGPGDKGSGIIASFPSPIGFSTPPSGTIATSGAQGNIIEQPPYPAPLGLLSPWSNAIDHIPKRLDETIQGGSTTGEFNTYIHYVPIIDTSTSPVTTEPVEIPYISNLTVVPSGELTDPYPLPSTFQVV